ncbi:hypothetical protein SALBM311S_06352 [Streptomyces alboniger]
MSMGGRFTGAGKIGSLSAGIGYVFTIVGKPGRVRCGGSRREIAVGVARGCQGPVE